MATNLACIGLAIPERDDFARLVATAQRNADTLGRRGDVELFRWQDDSGARLVLGRDGAELADFLPSFAAEPGVALADVRPVNNTVSRAAVVDADGTELLAIDIEPEQQRTLRELGRVDAAPASVIAFGTDVAFFADADAYLASPRSVIDGRGALRYTADSFVAYGAENQGDEIEAFAHLAGAVLAVDERRNHLTAQRFLVVRVAVLGFEVTLLTPLGEDSQLPVVGSVVAGTVFCVADLMDVPHAEFGEPDEPPARRESLRQRWFGP